MTGSPIIQNNRIVGFIDFCDVHNQTITVRGRKWHFDFDEMFGPLWLKKDGHTPRKNQSPAKHVWDEWEKWHKRWKRRQQ